MTKTESSDLGPIIYFGIYDRGKPRNRLMIEALRSTGRDVIEINNDIWAGIEDKSQTGWRLKLFLVLRWLAAYPVLIWRYLRAPRHKVVAIGYPGQLDVLVLWPFAKLRGASIALDAFISIYDTVVDDRKLVRPGGLIARLLWLWEYLAYRAADLVILDTRAHARHFEELFRLSGDHLGAVMVGAEAEQFHRLDAGQRRKGDPLRVLFYGQFIPLHGIQTIVEAARMSKDRPVKIEWMLIGDGQTAGLIKSQIDADPIANLEWTPWLPYEHLRNHIERAHVGLGIFGTSGKASRVIPNKVFQILSAGRPVVTRDGPAIRELISPETKGVRLVAAGDAEALLSAVIDLGESGEVPPGDITASFSLERLGEDYQRLLGTMLER